MAENNFNKFGAKAHGTLIGNWEEERELKDFTGTHRTIPKQHIPKKHLDFEKTIEPTFKQDNTKERIYGQGFYTDFHSEAYGIGKGKNKADTLPTKGKKTAMMEREIERAVLRELQDKEEEEKRMQEVINLQIIVIIMIPLNLHQFYFIFQLI